MLNTKIAGLGYYVPDRVVTNKELESLMETTDEWIQERTGIKERRFVERYQDTTATMGAKAASIAIERAGITPDQVDFIIFATISPDYYFPGCGVLVQRLLDCTGVEAPALDIRNQCSGFVYGLSIADQFIKTGMYKNILLIGSETHSMGLDISTTGRNVSVIFGDGAGAAILQPTDVPGQGILTTVLHSNGTNAEELALLSPGCHAGFHQTPEHYGFDSTKAEGDWSSTFANQHMLDNGQFYPFMNGQLVFKTAVVKFYEVIMESLAKVGLTPEDINMLVPHQANLRISQFIQKSLKLRDDQVTNNIQKYGNTTAASIPIALTEAWEAGKIKAGDLVCLAAFGSGFTWGSALIRW
jgi:3-oxoacyl-[acyl-carrier-protein] synthase III